MHMLKPKTLDKAITLARLQEKGYYTLLAKAKTINIHHVFHVSILKKKLGQQAIP